MVVQFTVDEEGNPGDPVILRGIGGGCDEEVIRVITEHARFKPAISQGEPVPVRMATSMLFKLRKGLLCIGTSASFRFLLLAAKRIRCIFCSRSQEVSRI